MIVFLSVIFYNTKQNVSELDYIITFMPISLAYIIAAAVEINYSLSHNTKSLSSFGSSLSVAFSFFCVVKN
jgi:hypothetical protein